MLRNTLLPIACFLALNAPATLAGHDESVVRIDVTGHDEVYRLGREPGLTVIDARDDFIRAYADEAAVTRLRARGYRVTPLDERLRFRTADELDDYRSFAEVCSTLEALAAGYPAITRLETLGFSADGHPIPGMKVTDNPGDDEPEACIRLIGTHHGNEKISTEVTLSFLEFLCENYAGSPSVRDLVDGREFWVIPVLNPDGHIADRRTNGNGVDLNRDYGYEWEVYSGPFTQPETRVMHDHGERCMPTLEYEYHSAASYVNYLWDNHPADPPDSSWIITLSQRYADSTYGSRTTELDPINGYEWYEVHGSCQDFTFGVFGGLAWTIETREPSTQARVDSICLANRRALLDMSLLAGWGAAGRVYDSVTGEPLFARVEFLDPRRWHTYTDLPAGDFHRMVAPGTYQLRVTANGYEPRTVSGVVVPDTGGVFVEVPLAPAAPEPWFHPRMVVSLRRIDDSHVYTDWVTDALGPPDSAYYPLGSQQSEAVLDAGEATPVYDRTGDDIIVHASGSYTAYASNDRYGNWQSLGAATGTASFDLATPGLDSARYLRILNSGGASLDGISFLGRPPSGASAMPGVVFIPRLEVSPIPARDRALIRFALPPSGRARVSVVDLAGRLVRALSGAGTGELQWNLKGGNGERVADGIYFCRLETARGTVTRKLVVRR